jgi:DNA replication protein DnaC
MIESSDRFNALPTSDQNQGHLERHALNAEQPAAKQIILSGASTSVLGSAGTGKTYLMLDVVAELRALDNTVIQDCNNWASGPVDRQHYLHS